VRRTINGYTILHPVIDGVIDYSTYVYEHRLVFELANNTKLRKDQHVHHINHIRSDNRPENLVALTRTEHALLHAHENGFHLGINHCIDCGARLQSWKPIRCPACASKHRRVKSHPTKDQLAQMITTMNNSEIARMLGVSDTAVRKWRAKYNLPSAYEQKRMNIAKSTAI